MREHERKDFRHHCGRLLFRAWFPAGTYLETRCPKCGGTFVVDTRNQNGHGKVTLIKKSLASALELNIKDIGDNAQFGELPGWDSIGHMEVLMELEKVFGIEINADTIKGLVNIPAICEHIQSTNA